MDVFNNEIAQSSFLAKFKVSFSRKKSPEFQKQKNVKNKHSTVEFPPIWEVEYHENHSLELRLSFWVSKGSIPLGAVKFFKLSESARYHCFW